MQNIEITLEDRDWPKLKLIVKHGTRVQTSECSYDKAVVQFQPLVSKAIEQVINQQVNLRRQGHGTT